VGLCLYNNLEPEAAWVIGEHDEVGPADVDALQGSVDELHQHLGLASDRAPRTISPARIGGRSYGNERALDPTGSPSVPPSGILEPWSY
jgi:hypothetical protein